MIFDVFLGFTCPDDCTTSSQGTCDTLTGTCNCLAGFLGDTCAGIASYITWPKWSTRELWPLGHIILSKFVLDIQCPDDCTDPSVGTCDLSSGICTCENGFTGENCAGKSKNLISSNISDQFQLFSCLKIILGGKKNLFKSFFPT